MRRLLAVTALSIAALVGAPALAESSAVGAWSIASETPQGKREATLTVTESGGAYTVDYAPVMPAGGPPAGGPGAGGPPPAATISDVVAEGDSLSFKRAFTGPQGAIEISYALTVSGDTISGTASSSFGDMPVTGARKQ